MQSLGSLLFVEDNFLLATTAAAVLADHGFAVELAPDAHAALELIAARAFDCIVIDVELPGGMSGVELADAIRQRWPELPMVLATGYTAEHVPAPPRVPVLQKPYRFQEIIASVMDARGPVLIRSGHSNAGDGANAGDAGPAPAST